MDEVKNPRKPLYYYWAVAMIILMMFNLLAKPWYLRSQITEVDYGTFMNMTNEKKISRVEIQDNQILFTDKDNKIYRTGLMDDSGRTERLYKSGAKFSSQIVEETSPILSVGCAASYLLGTRALHAEKDDGAYGRFRLNDVRHGQKQSPHLCEIH